MPISGGFGGSCVSLATSRCHGVRFRITFYVVSALNFGVIPGKGYISTTECEHLPFFWKPCRNYFRIIFTENKLKRKRADGKSAKAVREQVFLSESGIVESSVSRPSAYCQGCAL